MNISTTHHINSLHQDKPHHDNQTLAVIVIVATVFILSLGDALIKDIHTEFVLWQIFVLRSLVALAALGLVLRLKFRNLSLRPNSMFWVLIRSLMLAIMWVFYYAALPHIPFSIAASAYYTLPLFITLFSALISGERISVLGWIAVGVGFIGVVLILKPSSGDFNIYALLPILAAILYALAMILTRTKCRNEHPVILTVWLNIAFLIIGIVATFGLGYVSSPNDISPFLSNIWPDMTGASWVIIVMLSLSALIAAIGAAFAYQRGKSSVIATFDFAYIGFAVIWGIVFFNEIPDLTSLVGIAMIVIAGTIAVTRQR